MKKLLIFLLVLLVSPDGFPQVGIGTQTPQSSAMLEVTSNTKGLLPPRVTLAEMNAISSPAPGLVVYCTDFNASGGCLMIYVSNHWECTNAESALVAPVASAATLAGCNTFTANWTGVTGATGYLVDVSTAADFSTFVSGYNGYDAGNQLSAAIVGLTSATTYHYRVRAYNASYTSGNSGVITATTSSVQSAPVAFSSTNMAINGFTANWGAVPGATEYRFDLSTVNTFASFVGSFNNYNAFAATSLTVTVPSAGIYYYRVRSVGACGTSANSNVISAQANSPNCDQTLTYGTVVVQGLTWHDRNLGALRVAQSYNDYEAYGWLFQWGRLMDGHQCVTWTSSTSGTFLNGNTSTRCTNGVCENALFVTSGNNDWNLNTSNVLWNDDSRGSNDPCPTGFRIPSKNELFILSGDYDPGYVGAYGSAIKMTINRYRSSVNGTMSTTANEGYYWSSTYYDTQKAWELRNLDSGTILQQSTRSNGIAVRCIQQ